MYLEVKSIRLLLFKTIKHTHTHLQAHTQTHTHTRARIQTGTHTCMNTYIHVVKNR